MCRGYLHKPMNMNQSSITNVGSVIHTDTHVLLVLQRVSQKWGIPKGKIEKGESNDLAISREIREETGLVKDKLNITQTDMYNNSKYHYARLKITCNNLPFVWPQDRKEIVFASWFPINEIPLDKLNSASRLALRKFNLIQ